MKMEYRLFTRFGRERVKRGSRRTRCRKEVRIYDSVQGLISFSPLVTISSRKNGESEIFNSS